MLTSTIVRLRAVAPGELPNTTGQFGHAAFLDLVRTVAPDLARALHDVDARKPFTVSPLRVPDRARVNNHIRLREGEGCSMRFTILDPALFQSFQTAFVIPSFTAAIHLQNVGFIVEEVITTPRADGWTGYTTFAELCDGAANDKTIVLRFYSPTAFSLGDTGAGKQFALFPEPWRVFDSLGRRWSEFADAPFDAQALRAWVEAHVLVSEFRDLNTAILRFDRFVQKGFVGEVTYEVKSADEQMTRGINALADFALYAGVGYRTTWGMGQARRI